MAEVSKDVNLTEEARQKLAILDEELALCQWIDLRETSVIKLQQLLGSGTLTSVDLVQYYKTRIGAMDPFLRAVIELNPDAEEIAQQMDVLRNDGEHLGPLHGIPILIKDNISTADRMETTAGSLALIGLKPKEDSEIVKRLRAGGGILLGKANLSEFSNFRSSNPKNGWSGRGGQTIHAYVARQDPIGSSTGSSVAVGTNMAPVALGSETDGSIVQPASQASSVGLKTTFGRVPTTGVIPISCTQDVVGPITRTVADAAIVFGVIASDGLKPGCFDFATGFVSCADKNLRVGVLRDPNWNEEGVKDVIPAFENILTILTDAGITVVDPVSAAEGTQGIVTNESKMCIFTHEFKEGINDYLKNCSANNDACSNTITDLSGIIEFNVKYPCAEGFDQKVLETANKTEGLQSKVYKAERRKNQLGATIYAEYIFTKFTLDAIIVPTESDSYSIPASAGYPHISVPGGFQANGQPFGVSLYGMKDSDENLLLMANTIETKLQGRKPSKFLP